ncbi:hypothetical protein RRG08_009357 [Elysia crispata]|uniref:Phytanoyl-CoA dioxygenase n=1 Tax=Elysia crispata TaxID=231223 RepID=A0AAE0Z236_9GAST|nr:hypothetical protein RRG08_009357 [Elysia crispata]
MLLSAQTGSATSMESRIKMDHGARPERTFHSGLNSRGELESEMFTPQNREELETKGVTIVENVISQEDCDRHQQFFRDWLKNFPEGQWPETTNSLIQGYGAGHLQPAWEVRLAVRSVFAQVWGTNKLLSSMDFISIGRPPEDGEEKFWEDGDNWLHVGQSADRVSLHAYQGAVYLEDCEEDDWTFEVFEGSHTYFDEFMDRTDQWRCNKIDGPELEWFKSKGCKRRRVPCPKGGIILWDSRLVHANARPLKGRNHPGRWRYIVFVCMTPSAWASPCDLKVKQQAYEELKLTAHWPSEGVKMANNCAMPDPPEDPIELHELPEVAKTDDAKRLVGILPYDDKEADWLEQERELRSKFRPAWNKERWAKHMK